MALIIEPKGTPAVPPSKTATSRVEVTFGTPNPTTAKVDALKQRLSTPQNQNPVAPRPAGSTARAEQYAKLQNQAPQQTQQVGVKKQPMQDIEPPPSGMPSVNTAAQQQVQNEEAAPQVELNVEKSNEPEATSEPVNPQLAVLAKQERAIRKARQELRQQQDALKAREANMVSIEALKSDPLKVLSELGVTYDTLTEQQLSQINPDPNQQLLNKIAELEARLSSVDEQFTKRDTQAYEAALNQIRNDVKLLVDSDPTYETISATGETEAVVELIQRVFDKEGTILSVEEACRLVEDKLLERKLEEVKRLTALSKIRSKLGSPAEPVTEASEAQQPATQTTLSHANTVSRPMSARERAILAFENAKSKA